MFLFVNTDNLKFWNRLERLPNPWPSMVESINCIRLLTCENYDVIEILLPWSVPKISLPDML